MNWFRGAIVVLLVAWLQAGALPALRPFGVVPNLALVVVIVLSAKLPPVQSLPMAVAVGWLIDLSSGSDYGLRTGFMLLVAIAVALLKRMGSDLENLSLLASLVLAATVVLNLALLAGLALQHISLPIGTVLTRVVVESALNLLLIWPTNWMLGRLWGKPRDILVNLRGRHG